MFLLGHQLPDAQKVKVALTSFYGLSRHLSAQLCARLQVHDTAKVADLTDAQVTQLSAYLSSPGSIPARSASPIRGPLASSSSSSSGGGGGSSSSSSASSSSSSRAPESLPPSLRPVPSTDPLRSLVLESDLRRLVRSNIAHHRAVGSYRGRRHQQGLPVRGQRTSSNAQTAKKLNKPERRGYSTATSARLSGLSHSSSSSTSTSSGLGSLWSRGTTPTVSGLLALSRSRPSF
ncbi:unnamed protein product [Parajaminaea phylloscopi]